jgi:hypothetical protein
MFSTKESIVAYRANAALEQWSEFEYKSIINSLVLKVICLNDFVVVRWLLVCGRQLAGKWIVAVVVFF